MKTFLTLATWLTLTMFTINACDNDEDGDDGTTTPDAPPAAEDETSKEAATTISSVASIMPSGSNSSSLTGPQQVKIRNQYLTAVAEHNRARHLQDSSGIDFDLCALYEGDTLCQLQTDGTLETATDDMACTLECPGSSLDISCTLDDMQTQCDDETYTFSGTSTSSITCASASEKVFDLSISSTTEMSVLGGQFTSATDVVCNFSLDMTIDLDALTSGDASTDEDQESPFSTEELCENFSCTVGGAAVSCEDMKTAIEENSCEPVTTDDEGDENDS